MARTDPPHPFSTVRFPEHRRWFRCVARSLVLATLFVASPVLAQTAADKETARDLMDRGDDHFQARQYARALEAYRSAHQIMNVPTTGIEVARTQAALNQLVEARDVALEVGRMPKRPGEPPVFAGARADALQLAEELAGRIPSLELVLDGLPPDVPARLTIDGVELKGDARGLRKLNPGKHRVQVTAPGFRAADSEIVLAERETRRARLILIRSPGPSSAAAPTADAGATEPEVASSTSVWVYVGFGLGAAGIGVGSVTGLMSISRTNQAEEDCRPMDGVCTNPDVSGDLSSARTLATISNVGFGVGLAGVALGGVALLLGRDTKPRPAAGRFVVPTLGAGSVGVAGRF